MAEQPKPIMLDSREGVEILARFARGGGYVLNEWHERLAAKYGVSFDGIVIARQIPLT